MRLYTMCLAGAIALAAGITVPASAQDITYSTNPHRTLVNYSRPNDTGVPLCQTTDPSVPTLYCYTPDFIWTAYDILPVFEAGFFGQGQTIVVIDAFGSPTIQQDLAAFHSAFFPSDFPAPNLTVVCPMGCPHVNPKNMPQAEANWTFETSLDVEWVHAIAPLANIVLVVAPDPHGESINNAIQYAVTHYPGAIISQSFGSPEGGFRGNNSHIMQAHQAYQLATTLGTTVLAASGDLGANNGTYNFANPGYPASDPLVTAVGGTQGLPYPGGLVTFTGSCTTTVNPCIPTGYGAEQVWNEPAFSGTAAGATGGAVSLIFPPPAFQSGLGFTGRAVPDVSYNAAVNGGVLVAYSALGPAQAGFYITGGTSAAVVQWAGIFALANSVRTAELKTPVGYVNPTLYALAQTSPGDFHDITVGTNTLQGTTIGFSAAPGYDLATGLGSPDVLNLLIDFSILP